MRSGASDSPRSRSRASTAARRSTSPSPSSTSISRQEVAAPAATCGTPVGISRRAVTRSSATSATTCPVTSTSRRTVRSVTISATGLSAAPGLRPHHPLQRLPAPSARFAPTGDEPPNGRPARRDLQMPAGVVPAGPPAQGRGPPPPAAGRRCRNRAAASRCCAGSPSTTGGSPHPRGRPVPATSSVSDGSSKSSSATYLRSTSLSTVSMGQFYAVRTASARSAVWVAEWSLRDTSSPRHSPRPDDADPPVRRHARPASQPGVARRRSTRRADRTSHEVSAVGK